MKLIAASITLGAFLSVGNAFAIDLQPGEWLMVSDKGKEVHYCLTLAVALSNKNREKGSVLEVSGKTKNVFYKSIILENTATHRIEDLTYTTPERTAHIVTDMVKVSDTELQVAIVTDVEMAGKKTTEKSKLTQTFINATCSELSRGKALAQ
ncbi:hypothetical protein WAC87_002486 [Shigella flexneri]